MGFQSPVPSAVRREREQVVAGVGGVWSIVSCTLFYALLQMSLEFEGTGKKYREQHITRVNISILSASSYMFCYEFVLLPFKAAQVPQLMTACTAAGSDVSTSVNLTDSELTENRKFVLCCRMQQR